METSVNFPKQLPNQKMEKFLPENHYPIMDKNERDTYECRAFNG